MWPIDEHGFAHKQIALYIELGLVPQSAVFALRTVVTDALVRQLLESGQAEVYHQAHAAFDHVVLIEAPRHAQGNRVSAAQLLGISRTTLRAKLVGVGIETKEGSGEKE